MTLNDFYQFESYLNEKMTLNDSAAPLHIRKKFQSLFISKKYVQNVYKVTKTVGHFLVTFLDTLWSHVENHTAERFDMPWW